MTGRPTLLVVDGNSLLHRAYHGHGRGALPWVTTAGGRPVWAVAGLCGQIVAAAARVDAAAIVVGFDDPQVCARRDAPGGFAGYKAGRKPKPPELTVQLADAPAVLAAAGITVITPAGLEADDVLAAAAGAATAAGWAAVLATSDKDAYPLVSDTVSVLRIIDGGVDASPMITPDRLHTLTRLRAGQWADYAALAGDPSDNLPGVPGVGDVFARRLLAEFGTADAALAAAVAEPSRVAACASRPVAARLADPASRAAVELNRAVMAPRPVDLGAGVPGRLPLDPARVAAAFDAAGLHALAAAAVHALAGPPHALTGPPAAAGPVTRPATAPPGPVSAGAADPYHCCECGCQVQPHPKSVARREPVICGACSAAEDARRAPASHRRQKGPSAVDGRNELPQAAGRTP